jgi:hypothetical protein
MPSFDYRVVINPYNREEAEELLKRYSHKASLWATWSYDGTMLECDGFDDFDKLDSDEEYAYERIVQSKESG